jgi:hypothetical protein
MAAAGSILTPKRGAGAAAASSSMQQPSWNCNSAAVLLNEYVLGCIAQRFVYMLGSIKAGSSIAVRLPGA